MKVVINLYLKIDDFTKSFLRAFIGKVMVATSTPYTKLSERLGMDDHMVVLDVVESKIPGNMRSYGVVDKSQRITSCHNIILKFIVNVDCTKPVGYDCRCRTMTTMTDENVVR